MTTKPGDGPTSDEHGTGELGRGVVAPKGGPKGPIKDTMLKPLAKRFYKTASASDTAPFVILLDARAVKTPAKRPLHVPTRALAEAIAAEWNAQGAEINPALMPLTRFANTALDAVSQSLSEVAVDIVSYAGRDLLCYRAETPTDLVRAQKAKWDPVIAWADKSLGAHFRVVDGIMPVDQPPQSLAAVAKALEPHDAFRLTALHVMTTLTGSALLAVAHAQGFLNADDTWTAAHVDEDHQIALWGQDYEAADRRARRTKDFMAACRMLELLSVTE